MIIKTFPLQFTGDKHEEIKKAAENNGMTIKQFILIAIEKAIECSKGGE